MTIQRCLAITALVGAVGQLSWWAGVFFNKFPPSALIVLFTGIPLVIGVFGLIVVGLETGDKK